MKEMNLGFEIPSYITEEIDEYVSLLEKGKRSISRLENIKALSRLACVNGRMTEEQEECLIENIIKL